MIKVKAIKKKFLMFLSITVIAVTITYSAGAYVLQIGKLKKGVVNQTYYVGIDNQTISGLCVQAFNDWNYAVQNTNETRNMGFSFTRSNKITGSTIRCWTENRNNVEWYGHAFYYILDNNLNATEVSNAYRRDYADCILNLRYYDWTYNDPTQLEWKKIAAHEIGHALGLAHNETDKGVLMYPYYNVSTATSPTRDEVLGIYEKYS